MAQHDYNLANQSGADFRADLNNALSAIVTVNSGATAPSTTFAHQLWVDTSSSVLKIRNSANDAWVTTGVSITADNTFTGNLTGNVTGNVTGDITGNADTATALETARTINGTSFDGTANISFDTDSVSEGSTNLYYTSARFDSAFSGKSTSDLTEGINLYFTNARVESYLDAGTSTPTFASAVINTSLTGSAILDDDTFGTASVTTVATSESIKAYVDSQVGTVDTLSEILANGNTTGGTDIAFGDNDKAVFGNSSDLSIYHDGSNSYITDSGEGSLKIQSSTGLALQDSSGNNFAVFTDEGTGGKVELYKSSTVRLTTTTTGIDITGTATMDGLTVDGDATISDGNPTLSLVDTTATNQGAEFKHNAGTTTIQSSNTSTHGLIKFNSNNGTDTVTRMQIDRFGDISFYDDTGTSENLKWDASADSLNFVDNAKATFGASNDLEIYHDGSSSYIVEQGQGSLIIRGGLNTYMQNTNGVTMAAFGIGGTAQLRYNGSTKLVTSNTGIDVTGTVNVSEDVLLGSNGRIRVGSVGSLSSPTIYLDTDPNTGIYFPSVDSLGFVAGGTERLTVNTTGIDVTGTVTSDGLDINSSFSTAYFRTSSTSTNYRLANGGDGSFSIVETNGLTYVGQRLHIADGGDISFYDDTGTTQGLFWDASGESLGIGTTSIAVGTKLQIAGETRIYPSSGTGVLRFGSGGVEKGKLSVDSSSNMILETAGAERARIDSSGNVGIGTTPLFGHKFSVQASTDKNFTVDDNNGTGISLNAYNNSGSNVELAIKSNIFSVHSATAERFRITNGGNVGIGTDSPSRQVVIYNTSNSELELYSGTTSSGFIYFRDSGDSNIGALQYNHNGNYMAFRVNDAERARIDSSGNLLVSTTTNPVSSSSVTGLYYEADNYLAVATAGVTSYFNRQGSDGDITHFRKDGTTVGSIGTNGGRVYIGSGNSGIRLDYGTGNAVVPSDASGNLYNDGVDLGTTAGKFKDLYLSGTGYFGTSVGIGTSSPSAALNIVKSGLSTQFRVSNTESDATTKYGAIVGSHYTNAEEPITGMLMTSSSSVTGGTVSIGGGISAANAVNNILFYTAANNTTLTGSEAGRFDTSGNLLVGTTDTQIYDDNTDETGIVANGSIGQLQISTNNNTSLYLNRQNANGRIIDFRINGTRRGSIGTASDDLSINGGNNHSGIRFQATGLYPLYNENPANGTIDLGATGQKFQSLHLSNIAYIGNSSNTSGNRFVHVDGDADGVTTGYKVRTGVDGTGTSYHNAFVNPNGIVGTISTNGSATAYNTSSDARLKDVTGEARGLEVITKLNPVAYNWKADGKADEGLIAQEVKELVPNAVTGSEDEHYQMDYSKLVTHLVKAVQELEQQTIELKKEIANLKGE